MSFERSADGAASDTVNGKFTVPEAAGRDFQCGAAAEILRRHFLGPRV